MNFCLGPSVVHQSPCHPLRGWRGPGLCRSVPSRQGPPPITCMAPLNSSTPKCLASAQSASVVPVRDSHSLVTDTPSTTGRQIGTAGGNGTAGTHRDVPNPNGPIRQDDRQAFVNHLRHAMPYIKGHRGKTFVLVMPGEISKNADLLSDFLSDVTQLHDGKVHPHPDASVPDEDTSHPGNSQGVVDKRSRASGV